MSETGEPAPGLASIEIAPGYQPLVEKEDKRKSEGDSNQQLREEAAKRVAEEAPPLVRSLDLADNVTISAEQGAERLHALRRADERAAEIEENKKLKAKVDNERPLKDEPIADEPAAA